MDRKRNEITINYHNGTTSYRDHDLVVDAVTDALVSLKDPDVSSLVLVLLPDKVNKR